MLGPATHYPRHRHEAEEIYLPLSGTAAWQQGDARWRDRPPGTLIHHAGNEPHAMRTGAGPLLALYLWRSANLAQKARWTRRALKHRARAPSIACVASRDAPGLPAAAVRSAGASGRRRPRSTTPVPPPSRRRPSPGSPRTSAAMMAPSARIAIWVAKAVGVRDVQSSQRITQPQAPLLLEGDGHLVPGCVASPNSAMALTKGQPRKVSLANQRSSQSKHVQDLLEQGPIGCFGRDEVPRQIGDDRVRPSTENNCRACAC